jgi:hypothetical protein
MKLIDEISERPLRKVWVELTREELVDLFDHVRAHFEEPDVDRGRHCHIEASDGSGAQLSIAAST